MKTRIFGSTLLAVIGWQTASAVEVSWYRQLGSAVHIASNASASPWIIGTDNNVYKWDGKQFVNQNFTATDIGITTTDKFWLVDQFGLRAADGFYVSMKAREVAVGADNSAWIIGTDVRTGGYGVYQRSGVNSWNYANFGAVHIAVDSVGNVWVINDSNDIYMYNNATKNWDKKPGASTSSGVKVRSIHTGAVSGAVWMTTTQSIPGGFPIFQWNATKQAWEPYGTYGAVDIAEAAGVPWIVQSDGKLYSKAEAVTPSASVDVLLTWPTETPQASTPIYATGKGKLLCTTTGSTNDCQTDTKADYVGAYAFSTKCDSGFYDPIYGGSCWKCPDDDGKGPWIRSLDAVDKDTACWRVPKETTGKATLAKAPALAWDCPSGSFWDGYSPNGCCGSCWTCPANLPRRTAAAVWADNACASTLNDTTRAIFLNYKGCPKPDAADMNLPGKRSPGKPFLDGNRGLTNGACFACPITDSDGNFLITTRNLNSLADKDSNTGCSIQLKWQPSPFAEPGLAYMQGVKDLIWEQKLFDGARITGYLYDAAEAVGKGDATPAAKEWVTARWQEIASSPYNSDQLRGFIYLLLKQALSKDEAERTSAEKKLIKSFATYIQQRRTYLAQQALAMYDAWKTSDDLFKANTGQARTLNALFYYGTVPLDFHGTLSGLMALGASGGGTIGSAYAVSSYWQLKIAASAAAKNSQQLREVAVIWRAKGLSLLKSPLGLTAVTGASIIQVAFAILSSIAIDQFVAIETARPQLVAALTEASQPVNLNTLLASDNGDDTMLLFWSKAMDTWDTDDAQVLQLAASAQARAEQSAYTAPPKNYYAIPDAPTDRLSSGSTTGYLLQDQKLGSPNGKYEADMQSDGNFVIYTDKRRAIWATGTNGKGSAPYKLTLQADGALAVSGSDKTTWTNAVTGKTGPCTLIMQDDGNLVLKDNSSKQIWASNTSR